MMTAYFRLIASSLISALALGPWTALAEPVLPAATGSTALPAQVSTVQHPPGSGLTEAQLALSNPAIDSYLSAVLPDTPCSVLQDPTLRNQVYALVKTGYWDTGVQQAGFSPEQASQTVTRIFDLLNRGWYYDANRQMAVHFAGEIRQTAAQLAQQLTQSRRQAVITFLKDKGFATRLDYPLRQALLDSALSDWIDQKCLLASDLTPLDNATVSTGPLYQWLASRAVDGSGLTPAEQKALGQDSLRMDQALKQTVSEKLCTYHLNQSSDRRYLQYDRSLYSQAYQALIQSLIQIPGNNRLNTLGPEETYRLVATVAQRRYQAVEQQWSQRVQTMVSDSLRDYGLTLSRDTALNQQLHQVALLKLRQQVVDYPSLTEADLALFGQKLSQQTRQYLDEKIVWLIRQEADRLARQYGGLTTLSSADQVLFNQVLISSLYNAVALELQFETLRQQGKTPTQIVADYEHQLSQRLLTPDGQHKRHVFSGAERQLIARQKNTLQAWIAISQNAPPMVFTPERLQDIAQRYQVVEQADQVIRSRTLKKTLRESGVSVLLVGVGIVMPPVGAVLNTLNNTLPKRGTAAMPLAAVAPPDITRLDLSMGLSIPDKAALDQRLSDFSVCPAPKNTSTNF